VKDEQRMMPILFCARVTVSRVGSVSGDAMGHPGVAIDHVTHLSSLPAASAAATAAMDGCFVFIRPTRPVMWPTWFRPPARQTDVQL